MRGPSITPTGRLTCRGRGAALAQVEAPVLVLVRGRDFQPTADTEMELARLFPHARVEEKRRSGHFPWVDDPGAFVATLTGFLGPSSAG